MPKHIHRLTSDIIVYKNKKILLLKRSISPHKGKFVLPGGSVEYGEDPAKTAARELKEETGLTAEIKLIFNFYFINNKKIEPRGPTYSFVYLTKNIMGKIKTNYESSQIKWFGLDQIPKLAFHHQLIINDFQKYIKNK